MFYYFNPARPMNRNVEIFSWYTFAEIVVIGDYSRVIVQLFTNKLYAIGLLFYLAPVVIIKKLFLEGVLNISCHRPIKTIVAKFAKLCFRQNFNLSHDSKYYAK